MTLLLGNDPYHMGIGSAIDRRKKTDRVPPVFWHVYPGKTEESKEGNQSMTPSVGIDDFGRPLFEGAMAELTEQNYRRGESPLGVLAGGIDFFSRHPILRVTDPRLQSEVLEDCLFRIRQEEWCLEEC